MRERLGSRVVGAAGAANGGRVQPVHRQPASSPVKISLALLAAAAAFTSPSVARAAIPDSSTPAPASAAPAVAPAAAPVIVAATPPFDLAVAGTPAELLALERAKVDGIFGTLAQKEAMPRLFAADFAGISYSPFAPARGGAPTLEKLKQFPALPAGTFQMTDTHVFPLADGVSVVTYVCSGPGPDGQPWSAFLSSTWARRHGEWKTVYYQATVIPRP